MGAGPEQDSAPFWLGAGFVLEPDWPVAAELVADWLQQLHELHWSAALLQPGGVPEPAGATTAAAQGAELPAEGGNKERGGRR